MTRDDAAKGDDEERKSPLTPRLRAAYKLEAIGSLASGLAHEINNPIQSIMNYAQLIRRRATDPSLRECADEIAHEAHRVATIVRNLQAFVHDREEAPSAVRVADIVDHACMLFGAALQKEGISIEQRYADELPEVMCRPRSIEQIVVNLLMGARDALNDRFPAGGDDKRVVIEAHPVEGDNAARCVRLSIADYGTPIADRDIKRVFDPFAALPGRDQGAGLGLAVSFDIARANGASLSVERDAAASCTRFHLDLPTTLA